MPVTEGTAVPQDAVVTQDPQIVRLQEEKQIALLTASGTYFGQNPRRGYHGGAALEEVVIPCALLGYQASSLQTKLDKTSEPIAQPSPEEVQELAGVILTLADGRVINLELPFPPTRLEAKLLQALARLGEVSEGELKRAVGTRRIAGPLATLRERLASAGPDYDFVEGKSSGPEGTVYRFRIELLN